MPVFEIWLPADPMAVDGAAAVAPPAPVTDAVNAAAAVAAQDLMLGSSLDARLRRAALAAGEDHSRPDRDISDQICG